LFPHASVLTDKSDHRSRILSPPTILHLLLLFGHTLSCTLRLPQCARFAAGPVAAAYFLCPQFLAACLAHLSFYICCISSSRSVNMPIWLRRRMVSLAYFCHASCCLPQVLLPPPGPHQLQALPAVTPCSWWPGGSGCKLANMCCPAASSKEGTSRLSHKQGVWRGACDKPAVPALAEVEAGPHKCGRPHFHCDLERDTRRQALEAAGQRKSLALRRPRAASLAAHLGRAWGLFEQLCGPMHVRRVLRGAPGPAGSLPTAAKR